MPKQELNVAGESFGNSLIADNDIEHEAAWSFSAADGDKLLGPNGRNWEQYGRCHLGVDPNAQQDTKERYGYPFAKISGDEIKVFRHALDAVRSRASQQGETEIERAAGVMLQRIDKQKNPHDESKEREAQQDEAQISLDERRRPLTTIDHHYPSYAKGHKMDIEATATVEGQMPMMTPEPEQSGPGFKTPQLAKFRMTANTGAPMRLAGWKYPVVLDLEGGNIPHQNSPIRVDHDPQRGAGHTDAIRLEGGTLIATGIISRDTEAAREVKVSAKNGFPWRASVGANAEEVEFLKPGEKGVANGREYEGPLNIARRWTLGEISFVDMGADPHTDALIAKDGALFRIAAAKDGESDGGNGTVRRPVDGADAIDQAIVRAEKEAQRQGGIQKLVVEALGYRGANVNEIKAIAKQALDDGWDVRETELAFLRANRARGPQMTQGNMPTQPVLTAALCLACGMEDEELAKDRDFGPDVVTEAWPLRNRGLRGTLAAGLEASGQRVPHGSRELYDAVIEHQHNRSIQAAGFSSVNLPGILGNVANKILLEAFTKVDATYDRIAEQADFSNFHIHQIYRLEQTGDFSLVKPDGELPHGALGQDNYNNKLDTYGRMLTLTRQDIINDDLNAFRSLTAQLARRARIAVEKALYTLVAEGSDVFYTAARGNRFTSASLGITELGQAEAALIGMTDLNGDPIYAVPRFLVVPATLKFFAKQIYDSQLVNDFTASKARPTENPFRGMFEPIYSPYLNNSTITGYSATTWYLLADPLMLPAFQVAYLDGRRAPTIETAEALFNVLGLQMRAYWDFGVAQLDYRGAIKSTA